MDILIALQYAVDVANDNTHGYSQIRRGVIDKDCSKLTLDGLRYAGFPVGHATYSGNSYKPLIENGFVDMTKSVDMRTGKGMIDGDIVLRPVTQKRGGHMAFVRKNPKTGAIELVQAQGDFDGVLGDSSGKEIRIIPYYDGNFKYLLRYPKAVVISVVNPYKEPTGTHPDNSYFTGNDAGWFEFELKRIGYSLEDMGCKAGKLDEKVGSKVWKILHYEQKQAGQTPGTVGKKIRDYLKSVPSR